MLGESPGDFENNVGTPFVKHAPAGSVLERAIRRAGFDREQFVLWNAVPVQPPRNFLEGANYEGAAIAWGRPYLEKVIHDYKPRCILALGNIPCKATSGYSGRYLGVSNLRGYVIPSHWGVPVVASFHPSFLRRGAMSLLGVLIHDIKLAVAVAGGAPTRFFSPPLWRDFEYEPYTPRQLSEPLVPLGYITHPTEAQAWHYLDQVTKHPEWPIAYDIETPRSRSTDEEESDELADTEILSIQFSVAPDTGIFLPYRQPFDSISKKVMELPNVKVGANTWRFDDPLLEAHGFRLNGVRHDVRWAWHHLQPDIPASLQFITSFYAPQLGPWKHLHASHPEVYGIRDVDALQHIWRANGTA